jgi:hypothetical protein
VFKLLQIDAKRLRWAFGTDFPILRVATKYHGLPSFQDAGGGVVEETI